MENRRTPRGYKLRVYMDAIKEVKFTTDEVWLDQWIKLGGNSPFVSRAGWKYYLEQCALVEAEKYMEGRAS